MVCNSTNLFYFIFQRHLRDIQSYIWEFFDVLFFSLFLFSLSLFLVDCGIINAAVVMVIISSKMSWLSIWINVIDTTSEITPSDSNTLILLTTVDPGTQLVWSYMVYHSWVLSAQILYQ